MKKNIVIIASLVFVLVGSVAVAYAGGLFTKEPIYNEEEEQYELLEDYQGYINTNKIPYDEAKSFDSIPVYDSNQLLYGADDCGFFLGRDAGLYSLTPNTRKDLAKVILTAFPTEAIRESSKNGDIYVIYDTDINIRVFLFFSKEKNDYMTLDGFPVIMQKRLDYKQFADIQVGDNIEKVESVDPIIPLYVKFFDTGSDAAIKGYSEIGAGPTTIHLLTDGILKIEYERSKDNDYLITNIVYCEDFVLEGLNGKTCYQISELDYVK